MRTLLLLSLLLSLVSPIQTQSNSDEGSALAVRGFKWTKSRQTPEKLETPNNGPAAAMIAANKNYERNRRSLDPAGARDPNQDTVDGRSAALERSVQESRTPQPKPVDGFAYRVKVQNTSQKVVEIVFFEYQFKEIANPTTVARRQFLCAVNIKPDKERELQAFSSLGPSDVVSVNSLSNKSGNLFEERIVINRVEYADGTIWQRKDWNFAEVRLSIARATGTPWGAEMCRSL